MELAILILIISLLATQTSCQDGKLSFEVLLDNSTRF